MTAPLRVEQEAEEELEKAASRYEKERSGLGRRFLAEVADTIEQIRQFPHAGAPVPYVATELGARRAPVKGFPFHVVYLTTNNALRILAFAHYRRRPGYWSDRSS